MKSQLQLGNRAWRDGDPVVAIQCYLQALEETPSLGRFVSFNILMAQRLLARQRAHQPALRVAVCGWDLTRSASRAHTLCLLHERSAQVELIGCLQPGAGADIWAPLQDSRFPRHLIAGESEGFVERALRLVAEHPFDLVHLAQPRGANLVIGLLYQLIWGARVLVDVDDDDVLRRDVDAPGLPGRWPAGQALADRDWSRIALDLVDSLDGTTVSNPALRSRFGGTLLHHARDDARYAPSDRLRAAGRQRMQLGATPKVVLVCATQRNPAVLMEVGRAVAALARPDVVLVVAGTAADAQVAAELRAQHGIDCHLVGDVPFDAMPELMAAADVHVVLQDPKGGPGNMRLPASLAEALLMGLPVVARLAPQLLVEPLKLAIIDAATLPLVEALHQGLTDRTPEQRRQDAEATGLTRLLGLAHNAAILQSVVASALADGQPLSPDPQPDSWPDSQAGSRTQGLALSLPSMPEACLSLLRALHPPRALQALLALRSELALAPAAPVDSTAAAHQPQGKDVGGAVAPADSRSPKVAANGQATQPLTTPQLPTTSPPRSPPLTPDWTPCEGLLPSAQAGVLELLGQSLCLLPAAADGAATERPLTLMRAFASLHGRADAGSVRIRREGETQPPRLGLWPAGASWPARCSRWRLDAAGLLLADVWHADEHTLRLRLESLNPGQLQAHPSVLHAFQVQPGHDALCIGAEALVAGDGPAFVDVALVNPYWPVLLVLTDLQGYWRDATMLPFPSLCRGGSHHGELSAVGDRPVGMDSLEELSNSLAAELAAGPVVEGDARAPWAVGAVQVDLRSATGAERIFSPLVHEWLGEVMQVGALRPLPAQAGDADGLRDDLVQAFERRWPEGASVEARRRVQARSAGGALALSIAADSLPTISALVSRRLAMPPLAVVHSGAWVVADAITAQPRQLVSLPAMSESLLSLQPEGRPQGFPLLRRRQGTVADRADAAATAAATSGAVGAVSEALVPFPLAIRFRDGDREAQACLLHPLSPDSPHRLLRRIPGTLRQQPASVTVLLHLPVGAAPVGPLLDSLARQTAFAAVQVVVSLAAARAAERGSILATLESMFHGRHEVLLAESDSASAALNAAAAHAQGRQLLLASPAALLHNPRTLETLQTLLAEPGVVTAACVMLREVAVKRGHETRFYTGGLFPRQLNFDSVPSLVLDEPYTSDAFPMATYPVVANSMRLALVDAEAWRALGGLDAQRFPGHRADLDFCLRALRAGHVHLCTSATTASLLEPGLPEEHSDSHALGFMGLQRWQEVLARVSLIRSLGA